MLLLDSTAAVSLPAAICRSIMTAGSSTVAAAFSSAADSVAMAGAAMAGASNLRPENMPGTLRSKITRAQQAARVGSTFRQEVGVFFLGTVSF